MADCGDIDGSGRLPMRAPWVQNILQVHSLLLTIPGLGTFVRGLSDEVQPK